MSGAYVDTLTFIEYLVRDNDTPHDVLKGLVSTFEQTRVAYRIVDESVVPVGSDAEGEAVIGALERLNKLGAAGSRKHLLDAGSALSKGDWPGSVRESINAVESLARRLEPSATTLAPAFESARKEGIRASCAEKRLRSSLWIHKRRKWDTTRADRKFIGASR